MTEDIRRYARVGLVYQLLYPKCLEDPDYHARTLAEFVRREDIETFDCCLPYGADRRDKLAAVIRSCGKEDVAFATHLFPLRKLSFCSPEPHVQAQIRMIVADMVEQAVAIGARRFVFASGGPAPAEASAAHHKAFAEFCRWLCGQLRPHGISALLEPFDMTIDKKFLYGPTASCVRLIESLGADGADMGLELDMAHLPLMGEDFASAIRTAAPHLKRVHLGNCVCKDKGNPLYGDRHPPMGLPGGEIDVPELTEILRLLLEAGFLSRRSRGSMLIEMTPWPGKTVDESVTDAMARLARAWAAT